MSNLGSSKSLIQWILVKEKSLKYNVILFNSKKIKIKLNKTKREKYTLSLKLSNTYWKAKFLLRIYTHVEWVKDIWRD